MIKAIIFDCDGTLFDSETASLEAWKEVFTEYNVKFPFKKWTKCLGSSAKNFDVYSYLQKRVPVEISRENLLKKRLDRKMELTNLKGVRRGVKRYIEEAEKKNLKLAVASSSSREWVHWHLNRLGIFELFNLIICLEDVKFIKPHPELYLKTMAGLLLKPDEVLAIEDTPYGVSSAKTAGTFCLAVTNKITKQLDFQQADLKVNSFSQISLSELLTKANK